MNSVVDEWRNLELEFRQVESNHDTYLIELSRVHKLQNNCLQSVKSHAKRLSQIRDDLRRCAKKGNLDTTDRKLFEEIDKEMAETKGKLSNMQTELPVEDNGLYLKIILGSNLNLSLLNKGDRYRYKAEYEKFKTTVTAVTLVLFFVSYWFPWRVLDSICNFLMVWYYCTLTIRESILRINGSKIKGWWVIHHYASCVLGGVALTWKDGECYQMFRPQFIIFLNYMAFVQLLQSQYQRGCLRRLHALGQRHSMDITVEGFSSWMFKGLTFLLPFLLFAYLFQFYNAYVLVDLWIYHDCSGQWQVVGLAIIFFVLAGGNTFTTIAVIVRKIRSQKDPLTRFQFQTKYRSKND